MFSDEAYREMEEVIRLYPEKQAALLPLLHIAQREIGWLTPEAKEKVAAMVGVTPSHVEGVARFYTMFYNRKVGRHVIQVCRTLSCALTGAGAILEYMQKKLGIKVGETTADGKFTLIAVECLASCGTAPVMMVDDDHYENLTSEKIDRILDGLK